MIDYFEAYTPYSMLLAAAAVASAAAWALMFSYGLVSAWRNPHFWVAAAALLALAAMPVSGFLALVSVTPEQRAAYLEFRRISCAAGAVLQAAALLGAARSLRGAGCWIALAASLLANGFCAAALFLGAGKPLSDALPALAFFTFAAFLLISRRGLLSELSPLSMDGFVQELDDIVLIFQRDGKLIDSNRRAREAWPFLQDGMTREEFQQKAQIVLPGKTGGERAPLGGRGEVEVDLSSGGRRYTYVETPVRDKKGEAVATVVQLRDVTEVVLLEEELEKKNRELEAANVQLKAFLETAEMLVEEEHKAMAAARIREAAGGKIERLVEKLERAPAGDLYRRLPELAQDCRGVMADVRLAVRKLMEDGGGDE